MTRVLFTCWPFPGHVYPQLSIAVALRDRGGQAAFYTGGDARQAVEGEGFPVFAFDRVDGAWLRVHRREQAIGGRRQSLRVQHEAFRQWLVESVPDQVADLRAVIDGWRPDVIVTDAAMWGPPLVLQEALGIPVALASPMIYALVPGPDAPPPGRSRATAGTARARAVTWAVMHATDLAATGTRRRLDAIRAHHGLPAMGASVNAFLGRLPLYLVASVPELDFERRDLPAGVRYVGPLLWHPPELPGTREWLDQLPSSRPWVHVTEGTSHYQRPFVLHAAATGLAGAAMEAILTTGAHDPQTLGFSTSAPNVHVARFLSHDVLMPRCDAVVTTGGPGSIMAALRAGVPLVLVPTTWDKPDNARRVVEAGAGVWLSPRRCTAAGLRGAVEQVLGDPRYRAAARAAAARLAAAPGPPGAARLLEGLAGSPPVAATSTVGTGATR